MSTRLKNFVQRLQQQQCAAVLNTIRLIRFITKRSSEDHLVQAAGSLTFTTVLSLVPLLTVAFALFTAFPLFESFQHSLQDFLAGRLMPSQINSQILTYLNQFSDNAKGLTTIGSLALVVTSIITMMTVESAFNMIWHVHQPRPIVQRIFIYWSIITLGPILFGASLSISSYLASQSLLATDITSSISSVIRWILAAATLPLSALAFTTLYVYLPNCPVKWADALLGGTVAALAFESAKYGFGFYIRRFPTYTAVYGAFAAVPIFLLWVYLSWLITLFGAMLTSILPLVRTGKFQRPRFAGSDLLDAIKLLAYLHRARATALPAFTVADLSATLQCDTETMRHLITKLKAVGWIAKLELNDEQLNAANDEHWALIAQPERITLLALFDLFVINHTEFVSQLKSNSNEAKVTCIDEPTLSAALKDGKLNISLAELCTSKLCTSKQHGR